MILEAEQRVLGGLLLDTTAWDRIADIVKADDFTHRQHRLIYNAITALASDGTTADAITVSEWLERRGEIESAGGVAYLGSLAINTPSAVSNPITPKGAVSSSNSFSATVCGAWSVATTSSVPSAKARRNAAWSAALRSGGFIL